MMEIKLGLPVKDVSINQIFGLNYLDFYEKLGLKGHNGIDFKAKIGCNILASHKGEVIYAGKDNSGGISATICENTKGLSYKTIYYHLSELKCKRGDVVKAGDIIGLSGNTGKYTTGPHLHFGLKLTKDKITINGNNGYNGAIDPSKYFKKDWDRSHAYHRYYRKGSYLAEILVRFKNPWLHRQLIKRKMLYKVYDNEFINAITYGGWDFNSVMNPALYEIWGWSKKDEFENGKINFS